MGLLTTTKTISSKASTLHNTFVSHHPQLSHGRRIINPLNFKVDNHSEQDDSSTTATTTTTTTKGGTAVVTNDMQNVIVEQKKLVSKSRIIRSTPIQNVVTIETMDDFRDHIHAHQDKVVVVRFSASWCKMCKRTEPSFNRFARRNPNISFVNIPYNQRNSKLHESLNVSSVPYGHIYHSAKLVDEMSLSSKNWSSFEHSVNNLIV